MRTLVLLLVSSFCYAQAPANWGGMGASYNSFARPNVAGWLAWATKVTDTGPLYSFSIWDITSSKTKPYTAQTTLTTGIAPLVRKYGPISVYAVVTGGVTTSAMESGTSLLGAVSGGGVGIWKLGKTNWDLVLGVRAIHSAVLGTQEVYEFGVGRGF